MSKKKVIVEKNWTTGNEIYFVAHAKDDLSIIGTGSTKKSAIEDYEENLKIYERLNKKL